MLEMPIIDLIAGSTKAGIASVTITSQLRRDRRG
jgi:hypothetical protein